MKDIMRTVEVDDVATLLEEEQPLERATQEALVTQLYRRGEVSAGRACELLGIDCDRFLSRASALDVPVYLTTDEEWDREKATIDAWLAS